MISTEFEPSNWAVADQTATGFDQQKMFLDIKYAFNRLYNYCTKYLEN